MTVRRHIIAGIVLVVVTAPAVQAQEAAIQSVISDQIAAFQADDFDRAFSFASPGIQALFGTPGQFGIMVRNGYPMVWRPADVTFLDLRNESRGLIQSVMIRDGQGALHVLDYLMTKTDAGWKIDGVFLRRPAPGTA